MRTFLTLTFCLLICTFNLNAQDYLTISGKILDKKTDKAIAFANIGLPKQGIGTTSGDNGEFKLKIPKEYANQSVQISYIGYTTYRKKVSDLKSPVKIYLSQSATDLTEVLVLGKDNAKDIIRTAIDNIKVNYPSYPTNVLAFYRESLTDRDGEYEYLAEGVLRVYKSSYRTRKEGDVDLIQSRKMNLKNPLDTTLNARFSSGHMAPQRFDIVRNREDFINKKFLRAYSYKVESITSLNDKPVWVISFQKNENYTPKETKTAWWRQILGKTTEAIYARMRGKVYVEQGSYAIVRTEFEITPEGLEKQMDYPLYSGKWKGNYYITNYRKIGDKWHFSDALREGTYRNGELYANEVLITENDGARGKVIPYLDRMSKGGYFVNNTVAYDENFWANYNTKPMSAKLKESAVQMNNILKANEVFATDKMREIQALRDSTALAERMAELEKQQRENSELTEEELRDLAIGEPGMQQEKEKEIKFRVNFGAGLHLFPSSAQTIGVNYLTDDLTQNILSLNGEIMPRDYEIIGFYDYDIILGKHFFIRFGRGGNFIKSIHKETNAGLGLDFKLTRGRPVNLRFLAQHSRIRYGRYLGRATNDFGKFEVDDKTFNSDKIDVYYGSRTHNVKFSTELGIELGRHRGLFIRGTYYLPFAQQNAVFLRERGQIFGKKVRVPQSSAQVELTEGGNLTEIRPSFLFTVGFNFY
jgi:hypothetical protein